MVVGRRGFHLILSLFSLTIIAIIYNMPQPKWYYKSLSAMCMDNIVDNKEKWTALRSSEHVFCHFYHLREFLWNSWLLVFYFIMSFGLHTASHCLEYMTECFLQDHSLTEEMFDLLLSPHLKVLDLSEEMFELLLSPHLKVLDLSQEDYLDIELDAKRNFHIIPLASVRCSVIINSALL